MVNPDPETVALIISKVEAADEGKYEVVLTNDLGEAKTEGKLTLSGAPQFKEKIGDQVCSHFQNLGFGFFRSGLGMPSPTLTVAAAWYLIVVYVLNWCPHYHNSLHAFEQTVISTFYAYTYGIAGSVNYLAL